MKQIVVLFLSALWPGSLALAQNPGDCLVQDAAFQSTAGGCTDVVANLAWSAMQLQQTWDGASQVCGTLVEGGFDDWRLPTVAELQALAAHGGATHLDFYPFSATGYRYSNRTQGQWCQTVRLTDGHQKKVLRGSWLGFFCVRSVASSLAGSGAGGTSSSSLSASHVFANGRWNVLLRAPQHAGQPYLVFAGLRDTASPTGIGSPVLLGQGALAPQFFQPGPGHLDPVGRTAVSVDLLGLGLPNEAYSLLAMALVVMDPRQPEWAVYPLSAVAGG